MPVADKAPGFTRARQTGDNVGIQYGLKALLPGSITPEEFVTLNERIGCTDADSNWTATRSSVDRGAGPRYERNALQAGRVHCRLVPSRRRGRVHRARRRRQPLPHPRCQRDEDRASRLGAFAVRLARIPGRQCGVGKAHERVCVVLPLGFRSLSARRDGR